MSHKVSLSRFFHSQLSIGSRVKKYSCVIIIKLLCTFKCGPSVSNDTTLWLVDFYDLIICLLSCNLVFYYRLSSNFSIIALSIVISSVLCVCVKIFDQYNTNIWDFVLMPTNSCLFDGFTHTHHKNAIVGLGYNS